MFWRKLILFSLVLIVSLYAKQSFAYNTDTHAYLTDEIINFYNRSFSELQIPSSLRNYVLDGARREDDGIRSFNHFYDPVNDVGFNDVALGIWEKSKDWANDSGNQSGLKYKVPAVIASILSAVESGKISDISSETDFTWHKAIEYYANGANEKAFFLLGHVIHLMEDASVPDHTRNDPHLGDSPYENWTDRFNLGNKDQNLMNRLSSRDPILLSNLNSYFDGLATYSNNNFYSKDTIGIQSGYKLPTPVEYEKNGAFLLALNKDGDGSFLLFKQPEATSIFIKNKNEIILDSPDILSNYWSRLSTRAVQYGAGVLDLFIKEAEAAKNNLNLKNQGEQKSFIASIIDGAGNVVSVVGEAIQKAIGALENILKQNGVETGTPKINLPLENPPGDVTAEILSQKPILENANVEQIDSGLVVGEQTREGIESLPASSEEFTSVDREAIAKMLARLNDLMRQAIELKNKMEMSSGPDIRTADSQSVSGPNIRTGGYTSQVGTVTEFGGDSNSSDIINGGSDTVTSTPSTLPVQNAINHVLISEILFDVAGYDEGKEFIELYNPTGQILDLAGWSLRETIGDSTSSNSIAFFKGGGHVSDRTVIPSRGFLLVGFNNYEPSFYQGLTADITRATPLPNGDIHGSPQKVRIFLKDNDDNVINSVSYDGSSIPEIGYSLERKTSVGDSSCLMATGVNEFYGHNCDTDNDSDFEARANPNPQNSLSLPEPRQAPVLSGATAVYTPSTVSLNFRWNESVDAEGSTSTILYEIRDVSSSDIFATTTGMMTIQKGINEIGRSYDVIIHAIDRDGLGSATSSLSVRVPSFFDKFYFYADPRNLGSDVFDVYYGAYPFIPGTTNTWKLILFYVNTDALKDDHLVEENRFVPSAISNLISLNYPRCSGSGSNQPDNFLLLPEGDRCSVFGGGLYPQGFSGLEDPHFIIPITMPDSIGITTTSTYVTAAFYDWESRFGPYAGFRLVAVDRQKYHFQSSVPSSTSPNPPADVTVQFDDLHSRLNLSWIPSKDPDSLDSALSYEVNSSTSTEFSTSSWQLVSKNLTASISLAFSGPYKLGVRAIDDFGNTSLPAEKNWDFPEGFIYLPFQGESGGDPISDSGGAGQKFLISNNVNVSRLAMVMAMDGGPYSVTDTFVEIRADNSGGIGNLIASSSDIQHSWPMSDRPVQDELIFNFPQPVSLSANTYYWLVPVNGPGISNRNFIYGTATDSYPDGYWSGNPGADAYFYIR